MLSSLRLAASRTAARLSSRSLATLVQQPVLPAVTTAKPKPVQVRLTPGSDKKNIFVVPAPVVRPVAPRYSAKSSRVRGRTPNRIPKMLSNDATRIIGDVKIYLPSVFMRLVRNTGPHLGDPYTATFRTDLKLTKPDISNYLKNVYGLSITSLRTINYLAALKRNPIGGGYSRKGSTKNYKKVMVTMTEPFWYPEEKSSEWCNEHFERDRMEALRDRKMLKIGDGARYMVSSPRYRGAGKSIAEIARLAQLVEAGGLTAQNALPGDGKSVQRRPNGLKMRKNVMRSRGEKESTFKSGIEAKVAELTSQGW